ncbi:MULTISPECIES: helix-turn-helix transcriptional regulator [Planococcus]|uniref:Transcriptional regulator n=1 Tax=Planococcus faecalis TaxID=1598147 RepID=A0ABM6IS95_9BACL|nr:MULTISPECIES: helix-turn-helix transcriptional regulator [Planococcus]AQU79474.1 transcriptional regulator [Planococcus faecalis]MDJ0332554.1 helix-turn-helix transcriptional regulator [Planococcus sp. S3-L1]OHX51441.1 transcriptional regulator [Planococcus faecalis]
MSIQVFILSNLMKENSYPYKLKKQLSEPIPLDQLGGLTESKLYYHFETLAKKGLIEIVEIIKEEHRPDKQVFAITAKGREELPKLIYKLFENTDIVKDMIVGLISLQYVDKKKVVDILENNVNEIKERWNQLSGMEGKVQVTEEDKELRNFVRGYITARTDHNVQWLEELINKIKQGKL